MPVLGYYPRFARPRSTFGYDVDAYDFWFGQDGLFGDYSATPYGPAVQTLDAELRKFKCFDRPDVPTDENLRRAAKIVGDRYAWAANAREVYTFELAVAYLLSSDCATASPSVEYRNMGYQSKAEVILGVNTGTSSCVVRPGKTLPSRLHEVRHQVYEYLRGMHVWPLWTTNLKDELVKLEKILSGNTRVFICSPIAHLIASLMVFGPICDKIFQNWRAQWLIAGVSPKHGQWWEMLSRFDKFQKFWNSDFQGFDYSQPASLVELVNEMIIEWVANKEAARVLMTESLYAPVVMLKGLVVQKLGGTASGEYLTLFRNCLINETLLVAGHLDACGDDVDSHLVAALMGDDNLVGLDSHCCMTVESYTESCARRGVPLKGIEVFDNIHEPRFCGLQWNYHEPLPRELKVISSFVHYRSSEPRNRVQAVEQACDELCFSQHYLKARDWLRTLSAKFGCIPHVHTRDQAKAIWLGVDVGYKQVPETALARPVSVVSYLNRLAAYAA